MPRPVVVGGRKGFCSRALARRKTPHFAGPRPQSAAPHRCRTGARVVPRWERWCWFGQPAASGTPALDKEVVHVRCAPVGNFLVVAPVLGRSAIKSQQSRRAGQLAFDVSTPRYGFAVLYLAAIPPHLCRGEPRQKCSGRPGCSRPRCCRLLAQRVSAPLCSGPHPAPVGARADVEALCFYSWGSASSRGR